MYHTPGGNRILLGAERTFFTHMLATIIDLLADDDAEFGIAAFDQLQHNQKLYALYKAARGLLHPDEPAPKLSAFVESSVAVVYEQAKEQIFQEIDDPDVSGETSFWRRLVRDAAREQVAPDELPHDTDRDKEVWFVLIECLAGCVPGTTTTSPRKAWICHRKRVSTSERCSAWPTITTQMCPLIRRTNKSICTSTREGFDAGGEITTLSLSPTGTRCIAAE